MSFARIRDSDGGGTYHHQTQSNRLISRNGQPFPRDAAGSIIGDGVYTYVYNQAGQLTQVKLGVSVVATYRYDYLGRRTQKQIGATTTVYYYDQANHLIAETSSSGALLRTYVWRNNTPVVQIEQTGAQDQVYYLEVDALDTPRTARNETGTIIWQWHSDAFGTIPANETRTATDNRPTSICVSLDSTTTRKPACITTWPGITTLRWEDICSPILLGWQAA